MYFLSADKINPKPSVSSRNTNNLIHLPVCFSRQAAIPCLLITCLMPMKASVDAPGRAFIEQTSKIRELPSALA